MSDMGEMWNAVREQQKKERRSRGDRADEMLPELQFRLSEIGIRIEVKENHHWMIWGSGGALVGHYWPTTLKAQPHGGMVHSGVTISTFYNWVKKRAGQ